MGDKYLSDVINYKRDIEPYRFIKLYSGVGSGKSTFACRFVTGHKAKGEYEVPELTTLIITSRRAKVEETLREMGIKMQSRVGESGNLNADVLETGEERPLEYEKYVRIIPSDNPFIAEYVIHNQSVVCTNAYIDFHLRHCYNPSIPTTHLWNLFDVIIVDEVHSVITDATYQNAPFAVMELMKEYINRCKGNDNSIRCKHLIVMTGTPAPFEECATLEAPKEICAEYSLFDKCINVTPKTIILTDAYQAMLNLHGVLYDKKGKAVHFTNHVLNANSARNRWKLKDDVNIAVSYSSEEKRNALADEDLQKMKSVESALETGYLPDEVNLFVTTSRNKEGINIKNKDILSMFIESHVPSDIMQMAGRVRAGLENLYIITDAKQFNTEVDAVDVYFTQENIVNDKGDTSKPYSCGDANSHLYFLCLDNDITDLLFNKKAERTIYADYKDTLGKYVDYIEKRFPYVRYSFIDNRFKFYWQKMKAEQLVCEQNEAFKNAVTDGYLSAVALVKKWFPNSKVIFNLSAKDRAIELLSTYMAGKNSIEISPDEADKLLIELNIIFGEESRYLKPLLKRIGFNITEPIHKKSLVSILGNRILYKGDNPLPDAPKKRSPMKKSAKR